MARKKLDNLDDGENGYKDLSKRDPDELESCEDFDENHEPIYHTKNPIIEELFDKIDDEDEDINDSDIPEDYDD